MGSVVVCLTGGIVRRLEKNLACEGLIEGDKIAKESHGDERYGIDEKSSIYLAYQNAHIQGLESLSDCLGCQWVLGFLRMLGRPESAPQACIL